MPKPIKKEVKVVKNRDKPLLKKKITSSKLPKKDDKFLFLQDLINTYTKKLKIEKRLFYYKVNRRLKFEPTLRNLSYSEKGLVNFQLVLKDYQMLKKKEKGVYQLAPYLSSLSRMLTLIYRESSRVSGEEKAEKILKKSFETVNKKYTEIPDLEGYVPRAVMGKAAAAAAAAAYPVALMDQLITYLVKEVIEKGVKPSERKVKPTRNIPEEVKRVYVEMLGPLGGKQFEKLSSVKANSIIIQISGLEERGILDEKKAAVMKGKISQILGVRVTDPKVEIRKAYAETFGTIGPDLFKEIEKELSSDKVIRQIRELMKKGVLKEEEAEELKGKVMSIFGEKIPISEQIKKLYTTTFGPLGEELFHEVESNLNSDNILRHVEELTKRGVLKEKEAEVMKNKVQAAFGEKVELKEVEEKKAEISGLEKIKEKLLFWKIKNR